MILAIALKFLKIIFEKYWLNFFLFQSTLPKEVKANGSVEDDRQQ